ncbi:MAG TPA: glycosyltransferase [Chthoniobacterales bacterium]|nr:glycosyltransferase [Chthoniobacterales bacterium]
MSVESDAPDLSVILPTDAYETIQPVLEHLCRQTVANRLEIVLVAPASAAMTKARAHEGEFAAIRLVQIASLSPLGAARAAGIRAATAPLIFVGETHSYLHPDAAEKLIAAAAAGPWASVTPGFANGNPTSLFSWAGFLADYARWSAYLPAGEIPEAPLYNALYHRDLLLSMGDRLEHMLTHGDELRMALQARGHRAYFEPAARIDHININSLFESIHEHFLAGRLIGSQRVDRWSWFRRLAYALGAGLIPFVLVWRVLPGVRRTAQVESIPIATLPAILLLNVAKAAGELVSYIAGRNLAQQAAMDDYEIHKLDYLA